MFINETNFFSFLHKSIYFNEKKQFVSNCKKSFVNTFFFDFNKKNLCLTSFLFLFSLENYWFCKYWYRCLLKIYCKTIQILDKSLLMYFTFGLSPRPYSRTWICSLTLKFEVKSLELGVRVKIQSLGFGVRELKKLYEC